MEKSTETFDQSILRLLPPIDEILGTEAAGNLTSEAGRKHTAFLVREAVESLRLDIKNGSLNVVSNGSPTSREDMLAEVFARLQKAWAKERSARLRRVINATGVIIHTNLGRAPLSENARRAIAEEAAGYCNLEYDLNTGKRGKRGARAEMLLAQITGAEAAIIVNNCAAAAFLVLTVLASGREAIVSRGELVEIGGDFRIPDVLEQSGAVMREVGTTNRTKISDYAGAICEQTAVILRVHPSNYKIIGFTEKPSTAELADLARARGVLLYEDAGSGAIFDLNDCGPDDEPVISRLIESGVDIVSFSGDKLLGGPQSGLIVGRSELIEKIRNHPLYRALRVDKIIYSALEATLDSFAREKEKDEIPVLKMLSMSTEYLAERARSFANKLSEVLGADAALKISAIAGNSVIGGGAAPGVHKATTLLSLSHSEISEHELEKKLRNANPPVIARIEQDKVVIDLRTVTESEAAELLDILRQIR